jgi:DNA processing protein
MENNCRIRLALLSIPKIGRTRAHNIIDTFGDQFPSDASELHDAYNLAISKGLRLQSLGYKDITEALVKADRILDEYYSINVHAIPFGDTRMPKYFWEIGKDSPHVIFCKGDASCLKSNKNVAIVGTRDPSDWATKEAARISKYFSSNNFTIVSGLALGCDTIAHTSCLESSGKTIAVLAHGLDKIHPKKNTALSEKILESGGCLISEYKLGATAERGNFIQRNRLQAALSLGTIVIETNIDGGTMHTAKCCIDFERALACLNNDKISKEDFVFSGTHKLIQEHLAFKIAKESDYEIFLEKLNNSTSNSKCIQPRLFS